ncbi:MAG: polyribonucleotide nucleotidyltransferase [Ignavibacteria bacterium]|nr:polyribonucleotide nucleotidyltransferase [Ignavibacteria bacterium]
MMVIKEAEIGGKKLRIETGRMAKQANGSVLVSLGETTVLATAVCAETAKEDIDFFPLQVEYRERSSAAGKFPGGFIKREGKPSEKEVLSSRLIDRPIRPLFPEGFRNETQISATVFAFDGENDPDIVGAIGASAALAVSDIPFQGPIGEVRVGRINGELVLNPTAKEIAASDIELVVAGTEDSIMMVEGEAKQVSEAELLEALKFAHDAIKTIVQLQNELREACGKPKREFSPVPVPEDLKAAVMAQALEPFTQIVSSVLAKEERAAKNKELTLAVQEALKEQFPEQESLINSILHDLEKDLMRKRILTEGLRLDGRTVTQIRPITVDLSVLPRVHGSSLFTRGETQSLGSLTLGTKNDEQIVDGLLEEYTKRFMLHYNFPPYSVGEVGKMIGPGRREIGHGNLAERSLKYIIPTEKDFPYTIKLTSDILESNGSSSMATVCSGSLALMDGGVPVKAAVAGIAMGLIKEGDQYAVLSDILGNEDHLGDMDFKVAGTSEGITGFQMDIKIRGISFEIMEKALLQAKEGRLHILSIMNTAITQPREDLSKYAPRMLVIDIDPEQIGGLIGPAGKTVQKIQRTFNVEISIEDSGMVHIASLDLDSATRCRDYIKKMNSFPDIGGIYEGEVVKLLDFGALIELVPGKSGLLHISEIDMKRVNKVTDYFKEGDVVKVKLLKVENGKYSLSRKEVLKMEAAAAAAAAAPEEQTEAPAEPSENQ